jgi:hypothetical protein
MATSPSVAEAEAEAQKHLQHAFYNSLRYSASDITTFLPSTSIIIVVVDIQYFVSNISS